MGLYSARPWLHEMPHMPACCLHQHQHCTATMSLHLHRKPRPPLPQQEHRSCLKLMNLISCSSHLHSSQGGPLHVDHQ